MKREEFADHLLNDLIPFWNKMVDKEEGGFYGSCDAEGNIDKNADKGVILMSRILWFYSNAYIVTKNREFLDMARHQYGYIEECCYDHDFGGVFWSTTYDGKPADTIKHTYNQAFAIYATSTYFMASGDTNALDLAYELFDDIEEHCCDENGYLEAFDRRFVEIDNEKLSEHGVEAKRTTNTLLHVLEAYTVLYQVDQDIRVKRRLEEILSIFKSKIYNESNKHNDAFFDVDYNPLIDLQSYGHDVECSWLMARALEAIGDEAVCKWVEEIELAEVEQTYKDAYDEENGCLYNERINHDIDKKRVWWVQAEAIVAFYNAYQKTKDEKYLKASEAIWEFVKEKIIDKNSGEWWEDTSADNKVDNTQMMVHPWKGPYHHGRMCMEMMQRMEIKE